MNLIKFSVFLYLYNLLCWSKSILDCENGWTASNYSRTCLKIFHDLQPWQEARKSCLSQGADLVRITDSKMDKFVSSLLEVNASAYIGLRKTPTMKTFRWLDDDERAHYVNLKEPSEIHKDGVWCAMLNDLRVPRGEWVLSNCGAEEKYLCEKDRKGNNACDNQWTYLEYSKTCMKVFTSRKNFTNAEEQCESESGNLMKIWYYQKNTEIMGKLGNESNPVFIGLKAENHKLRWVTKDDETTWENLLNLQLQGPYSSGTWCATVLNTKPPAYWNLVDCLIPFEYICEKGKGCCPEGWTYSSASGTCIKIHDTYIEPYENASAICLEENANLVVIRNEETDSFIRDQISRDKGHSYWIGLNKRKDSRRYRWLELSDDVLYTGLAVNRIVNYAAYPENCVQIWQCCDLENTWIPKFCQNTSAKVICEYCKACQNEREDSGNSEGCCKNCAGDTAINTHAGWCIFGCVAGFEGEICMTPCKEGWYGPNCKTNCSLNCVGEPSSCDPVTGACRDGCLDGYSGDFCDLRLTTESPQTYSETGYGSEGIGSLQIALISMAVFVALVILVFALPHLVKGRKAPLEKPASSEKQSISRSTSGDSSSSGTRTGSSGSSVDTVFDLSDHFDYR